MSSGSAPARANTPPFVVHELDEPGQGEAGRVVDVGDRRAVEHEPADLVGAAVDERLDVVDEPVRVGVEELGVEAEDEQSGQALVPGSAAV